MQYQKSKRLSIISIFITALCCFIFQGNTITAYGSSGFSCVFLSQYQKEIDIGDEFYLLAWTSNGKKPSWKSSDSKVASVNTYGLVTGKRAGTVKITAKISGAEMSCRVTVRKTEVSLSQKSITLERNESIKLNAKTSNGAAVKWKSSRKSVAVVDESGLVTAVKPGEAVITASVDGTGVTCLVTVKQPDVALNQELVTLFRGQTVKLKAEVSSGIAPVWKSNKKSVAFVDENGTVTAVKHGTAVITAKVDGVSRICQVTVKQPEITLSDTELTLSPGESVSLTAEVSSGNPVIWSVSNKKVAEITGDGKVTAYKKGTCYLYASEDGVKERCVLRVQ